MGVAPRARRARGGARPAHCLAEGCNGHLTCGPDRHGGRALHTIYAAPPGQLTTAPLAHLANPEIPQLTHPKSPRMTDVTGEICVYGEGSTTTPPLVREGRAMRARGRPRWRP